MVNVRKSKTRSDFLSLVIIEVIFKKETALSFQHFFCEMALKIILGIPNARKIMYIRGRSSIT